jgi:FkbM family methyltransferase
VDALRRRLLPPLTGQRGERALAAAVLAPEVRPSARFVGGELSRRPSTGTYRLRGSDVALLLRHRGADLVTFAEIFGHRHYELPASVRDELRRRGTVTVLDLGANAGLFGAFALHALHEIAAPLRIVAYEPDPAHHALLERFAALNGGRAQWELHRSIAAAVDGTRHFVTGAGPSSRAAPAGAEIGDRLPARDVLPDVVRADLIKMDVEGGEWELLSDRRFAATQAAGVVLEYHRHLAPSHDTRGAAASLLAEAGFEVAGGHHSADGSGILWGLRA